jgi:hypothetical protein
MQPVHIWCSSDTPTVKKAITKFLMVNKQMNKITREEKTTVEHSPEMRGRQGARMKQRRKEEEKEFGGQGQLCNGWCNGWSLQNKQLRRMMFAK